MLTSALLLAAVDSISPLPAKVSLGCRVVWRLTVGCRDRRGVVTEVVETMVNEEMTFSYVIQLDPVVAERRQLISKYGSAVAQNMKVVWCEEEMWKDDASCATNIYLEGSILQVLDNTNTSGIGCFYAIQLDSVRAVRNMLRNEHPFDLYSDAYASQAMLWQMDSQNDTLQLSKRLTDIDAAVQAARCKHTENDIGASCSNHPCLHPTPCASNSQVHVDRPCTRAFEEQSRRIFLDQTFVKHDRLGKYRKWSRFST